MNKYFIYVLFHSAHNVSNDGNLMVFWSQDKFIINLGHRALSAHEENKCTFDARRNHPYSKLALNVHHLTHYNMGIGLKYI